MGRRILLAGLILLVVTGIVIGIALWNIKRSELPLLFSAQFGPDISSSSSPPQQMWKAGDSLILADIMGTVQRQMLDGQVMWSYTPRNKPMTQLMQAGLDGTIFIGGIDGELIALGQDGRERWKRKLAGSRDWSVSPAPSVDGGVYVTVADGHLYALDSRGEQRWHVEQTGLSRMAPVVSPDGLRIFAKMADGSVRAYDSEGQPLWQSQANIASIIPGILNSRGELVLVHPAGYVSAIDGSSGGLVFSVNTGGELGDKLALLSDDSICCVRRGTAGTGELLCYDRTGVLRFTREFDNLFGRILADRSGGLYVFDAAREHRGLLSRIPMLGSQSARLIRLDSQGNLVNSRSLQCQLLYTNMLQRNDGSVLLYGCDGILYCVGN